MNLHLFMEVFLLGLVLSADSFSAAIAMGSRPFLAKDAYRFAAASGGAECLMTVFGALAGQQIVHRFASIDHWIAFGLLAAVAGHMTYEGIQALRGEHGEDEKLEFHSFFKVLVVSLATSLDAFGVGIGLGISNKPLAPFVVSIGIWAFAATIMGLYLGKKLSSKFGSIMNLVGATILFAIAIQMLKI